MKRTPNVIRSTAVAVAIAAALTGCAGGGADTHASASAEPTRNTGAPIMRVPEKTTQTSIKIIVNGGSVPADTKATVYGFADEKFGSEASCGSETSDQTVTLTGDGTDQTVTFPAYPGVWHWVLAAGKYVSSCGAKGSTTRVLNDTNLSVNLPDRATVGKPAAIEAFSTSYGALALPVTVVAYGPYNSLPLALADKCGDGPEAWKGDVSIETGAGVASADVKFTPDEAGVYRIVASAAETDQSSAVDGCDGKTTTLSVSEK